MKHTQHNDPFEYDQYKDETFWDFSLQRDWPMIVGVLVMVAATTLIYLIAF